MDNIDPWMTKLAGVAGAALSLKFIAGTWPERITMAIGGAVISLYAAPFVSRITSLPEGLSGFLVGMFGMAVCAKAWEALNQLQAAEVLKSWLSKR